MEFRHTSHVLSTSSMYSKAWPGLIQEGLLEMTFVLMEGEQGCAMAVRQS